MKELIKNELEQASKVLDLFLSDSENISAIEKAAQLFVDALKNGKKAMACGNGGSACDALHFCEELTGRFRDNRQPLPALCLNADVAHMTCTANDFGYNEVFSRYLQALGNQGDVLLAISTSGNSDNILKTVEVAKQKGIKVVALTGKDGGKLASLCDVEIRVPHLGYSDRIQEIHIKVIHILVLLIEKGVL